MDINAYCVSENNLRGVLLKTNLSLPHPHGSSIFSYALDQIPQLIAALGEPAFRAKQLIEWLYVKHAAHYDEMLNLPKGLREKLEAVAPLQRAELILQEESTDGTHKYLIRLADGALIETVGLPSQSKSLDQESERLTVCVSSQVGCAMACSFCETGKGGFLRNLLPGELAEQVRIAGEDFGRRISNVVVMGQGEPFANYDNTLAGLHILNSAQAYNIGARHITLSTSGLIAGINRLAEEPEQFTLAVSLHSALQTTRNGLMPGLANQTLPELSRALKNYINKTGRRPSLEYTLIDGPSSSVEEISALASFAKMLSAHVNLIPINPSPSDKEKLSPPSKSRQHQIRVALEKAGVNATLRTSRGADIAAACGQLLSRELTTPQ